MLWMKAPARPAVIALLATTAVVASACAAGAGVGNKAGGPNQPVILRMADVTGDLGFTPGIAFSVKRVSELSGGGMRIDIVYRVGGFAMDAEQQAVRDVARGDFDLGFTGTSVFDTMGVTSFQALTAPMLIDSYPLEDAVIRSGLPKRMMAGLGKLNVTGLAVLGDGLRRPIGSGTRSSVQPTGGASRSAPTGQRAKRPPSGLWARPPARDLRQLVTRPSGRACCRAST